MKVEEKIAVIESVEANVVNFLERASNLLRQFPDVEDDPMTSLADQFSSIQESMKNLKQLKHGPSDAFGKEERMEGDYEGGVPLTREQLDCMSSLSGRSGISCNDPLKRNWRREALNNIKRRIKEGL